MQQPQSTSFDLDVIFTPENRSNLSQDLITIRDYIRWSYTLLVSVEASQQIYFGHGTENAWDEAVALTLTALCLPWDIAEREPTILNAALTQMERERIIKWLQIRLVERLPLPYITGEAWFCGLPFWVDSRVLIPRSPIAEMVEARFSPWWPDGQEPGRILDLCTGSGALAVAMACAFPNTQIDAVDLSPDALAVAASNVARHGLEEQVHLIESDLFNALDVEQGRYDLIVSNPPYVGAAEMAQLPQEYRHEPAMALFAEENGIDIVRRMLSDAKALLSPEGLLVVEVGNTAELMEDEFPELPFTWVEFERGGFGVFVLKASDLPGA